MKEPSRCVSPAASSGEAAEGREGEALLGLCQTVVEGIPRHSPVTPVQNGEDICTGLCASVCRKKSLQNSVCCCVGLPHHLSVCVRRMRTASTSPCVPTCGSSRQAACWRAPARRRASSACWRTRGPRWWEAEANRSSGARCWLSCVDKR